MRTGRANLDAMIRVSSIAAEEPVFILRPSDPDAADTVRDWAARHMRRGGHAANAESALQQADEMDAWPVRKEPDVDHLGEDERKHLEYQFSRRAVHEGLVDAVPDMLAEQRGLDLGIARARVFLSSDVLLEVLSHPIGVVRTWSRFRRETREDREDPRGPTDAEARETVRWLIRLAFENGQAWRQAAQLQIDQIKARDAKARERKAAHV